MSNPRPGRKGHSQEFRDSVVKAIANGGKVREVAKLYGVSKASIWLWCNEGVTRKRNVVIPPNCHPYRPHYGRGFCRQCYRSQWDRDGHVEGERRRAA